MKRVLRAALGLTLGLLWWFYGSDYVSHPGSYRVGIFLIIAAVGAGFFHVAALHRFHRMTRIIRVAEAAGTVAPGSTLFAANQRFRFTVRVLEGVWVIGVGVLALVAKQHPEIARNPEYGRFIITYFFGSIVLTGYLTFRDLWVLHKVRSMDVKLVDAGVVHDSHH